MRIREITSAWRFARFCDFKMVVVWAIPITNRVSFEEIVFFNSAKNVSSWLRTVIISKMITGTWNRFTPLFASFFVFSYCMVAVGVVIKNLNAALIGIGLLTLLMGIYYIFYFKKPN